MGEDFSEIFERPAEVRIRAPPPAAQRERAAARADEVLEWLSHLGEELALIERLEKLEEDLRGSDSSVMECKHIATEGERPLVCSSFLLKHEEVLRQLLALSKTAYAVYRVYKEAQYIDPALAPRRHHRIDRVYDLAVFALRGHVPLALADIWYDEIDTAVFVFELDCEARHIFAVVFHDGEAAFVTQRPRDAYYTCAFIEYTLSRAQLHSGAAAARALLRYLRQR